MMKSGLVLFCVLALMLLFTPNVSAQYADGMDGLSTNARSAAPAPETFSAFRPVQLVAPAVLVGAGTLVHCFAHDCIDIQFSDGISAWRGAAPEFEADDYVQYLPFVMAVGLGFLGPDADHVFWERTVELAFTAASLAVVTQTMKHLISSPRPNGVDDHSFPSGHTATAFAGAELVRMEYGPGWGAAAYTIASGVAFLRIYNKWHYLSDVLAGAGVGILCAHVGEWLLVPVKNLFKADVAVAPTIDPVSGGVCATLALNF